MADDSKRFSIVCMENQEATEMRFL